MDSASVSDAGGSMLRASKALLHLIVLEDRPDLDLAYAHSVLQPADRVRAMQISSSEVRRQFVLGRFLLWRTLEALCVARRPLRIDPRGKPYLEGRPVDFNLSHTHAAVALLLGTGELGVDIEPCARRVDVDRVAERTFTRDELRWMYDGEPRERFIRLWTLKEAYMKARGMGFRMGPKSFSVRPEGEFARITRSLVPLEPGWLLHSQRIGAFRVATAARGPGSDAGSTLRRYDGAELF